MTLETLTEAVKGGAAAIRIVTHLEPVGHERDKVFPPTYAGGEYALEDRYPAPLANVSTDGNGIQTKGDEKPVHAVLLHSVAGQANLLEEALKAAIVDESLKGVPVLKVSFDDTPAAEYLPEPITVLDAPHRVFDAIFRDSEVPAANKTLAVGFAETTAGRAIATASLANATPIYEWSPTSLLFGCWNSANDKVPGKIKGNLKFARAIVSEIVGYEIEQGVRVGGKGDPAGITGQAIYCLPSDETTTDANKTRHDSEGKPWFRKKGAPLAWTQNRNEAETAKDKKQQDVPVYQAIGLDWTVDERQAANDKNGKPVKWGKKGKPSELLLGQIAPSIGKGGDEGGGDRRKISAEDLRKLGGGVTMKYALQTTVLSLAALRRLRFPEDKSQAPERPVKGSAAPSPNAQSDPSGRHIAARTVLAALGLVAITAQRERDYFLRSRCELRAVDSPPFEFVVQGRKIEKEDQFTLTFSEAKALLQQAIDAPGAPTWKADSEMPALKPKANLAELIRLSFVHGGADEEVESSEPAPDANDQ
jgi:CRISPR-associated protein Csb1